MKNLALLLLITLSFFTSCSNDDNNDVLATVTFTVNVTGTLNDPSSIEYRNQEGVLITENLTRNLNKSFNVDSGYQVFFKIKGTVNGRVDLNVTATGNGNSFNENVSFGGDNQDFNHTITTTLK